jgi:hypothetical protein
LASNNIPWFPLYVDDVMNDPGLAMASEATWGVWFKMLIRMFRSSRCGVIWGTEEQLCRLLGIAQPEILEAALFEIENLNIGDVSRNGHGIVTVENRRMVKDEKEREQARKRKQKQRSKEKEMPTSQDCPEPDTQESHGRTQNTEHRTQNSEPIKHKNQEDIYTVFNKWKSSKNLISHRELSQAFETAISAKLKSFSVDEICSAIEEYDFICGSPDHYWTYSSWSIKDFLQRGLEKFLPESKPRDNYKNNGKPGSKGRDTDKGWDEIYEEAGFKPKTFAEKVQARNEREEQGVIRNGQE